MKLLYSRITALRLCACLLAIFPVCVNSQVYMQTESKRVNKGKVVTTKSEIYMELTNGQMTIHYSQPDNFYVLTNVFGEMTVYFPAKNEVMKQQNMFFSSENDIMYQFFSNNANDLGLKVSGFVLEETKYEEQYLVTIWKNTATGNSQFAKAKLVQEDYLPIYLAFYDKNGKIIQKIYFANWQNTQAAFFPTKITQIDYVAQNDSIVSRKVYSNVIIGPSAKERNVNIAIPQNAKLISTKK